MNSAHELAALGFDLTDDDALVISKAVTCVGSVIYGDLFVGGDAAVSADLICGGGAVTSEDYMQVFTGRIDDISDTGSVLYFVVPFTGWVKEWYSIVDGAVGASGGVLELNINGVAYASLSIAITDASAQGTVDHTVTESKDYARVVPGDIIRIDVDDACTNAVNAGIVILIYKTQE